VEGKPTVSQKPYRGRKILIATLLVVEEDFKTELKLSFEVFARALTPCEQIHSYEDTLLLTHALVMSALVLL
jgi:hypothetical protein